MRGMTTEERQKKRRSLVREALKNARQNAYKGHMSLVCEENFRFSSHDHGPAAHAYCKKDDCVCECHDD